MTEIRYVTGLLAFWDELLRRNPALLIDCCASGGRRNDLETLRRAVPLWKSDWAVEHDRDPIAAQAQMWGLAFWIPFSGTGPVVRTPYDMRSFMGPSYCYVEDTAHPIRDFGLLRRMIREWREIADNFLGDYYPLTAYSVAPQAWLAWQFDRPEAGRGVVQAFRRPASPVEAARFRLRGLDPDATYEVRDFDREGAARATGAELMAEGLPGRLVERPGSAIIVYRRLP
jgi:alpha-galactosidase